jgi:hypothetical protein
VEEITTTLESSNIRPPQTAVAINTLAKSRLAKSPACCPISPGSCFVYFGVGCTFWRCSSCICFTFEVPFDRRLLHDDKLDIAIMDEGGRRICLDHSEQLTTVNSILIGALNSSWSTLPCPKKNVWIMRGQCNFQHTFLAEFFRSLMTSRVRLGAIFLFVARRSARSPIWYARD